MLLSFGAAWPASIYRSYVSRQTGGKSLLFMYIVLLGYVFGLINKFIHGADYVVAFYVLDILMVSADLMLYYRNRAIEKKAACARLAVAEAAAELEEEMEEEEQEETV